MKGIIKKLPFLLLLILVIFQTKPAFLFKPNGKPREHGFGLDSEGYKKTMFNLHFFIIVSAVLITKYTSDNVTQV